jgi:hypothetical protein
MDRLKDALLGLAAFAEAKKTGDVVDLALAEITGQELGSALQVFLPDGTRIDLPFRLQFEHTPGQLKLGHRTCFDATLFFEMDETLREYLTTNYRKQADKEKQLFQKCDKVFARIGYFDLVVSLGSQYVEMSIIAATLEMGELLFESRSVRKQFCGLVDSCGGVLGLAVAGESVETIQDPARKVYIDHSDYYRGPCSKGESRFNVDGIVEDVLAQLRT